MGEARNPAIEAMFTIAPPPRAFRCGAATLVVTKAVLRFWEVLVPRRRRHSSTRQPPMAGWVVVVSSRPRSTRAPSAAIHAGDACPDPPRSARDERHLVG
jgi:hypothetical protein